MINKQDILDRATEWQLRPEIVEKDYVLGWLLSAIAIHPITKNLWIFKGGTSIKKCYFETYRFSEDLDFSLLPSAPYTENDLRQIFDQITDSVSNLSGITIDQKLTVIDPCRNKAGQTTFMARIYYQGPLGKARAPYKIKFDITNNELIVEPPIRRKIIHPYPDSLTENEGILCYAPDELLAEKTRALYERTLPRDLYDVVYLLENQTNIFGLTNTRNVFTKKCSSKNLKIPSAQELIQIIQGSQELSTEWHNMLAHQLPILPKLEDLLKKIPDLMKWIDGVTQVGSASQLDPIQNQDRVESPVGIQFWNTNLPIENIRFAGANHLMIEFTYHGKTRLVEPYSLRRPTNGNLLLYAWETSAGQIKAFKIEEMTNLRVTDTSFEPRREIDMTPQAVFSTAPLRAPAQSLIRI